MNSRSILLVACFIFFSASSSFASVCTNLVLDTLITPSAAVTCEDFPISIVLHNDSSGSYSNFRFAVQFQFDDSISSTSPLPDSVINNRWFYHHTIAGNDTDSIVINVIYGCETVTGLAELTNSPQDTLWFYDGNNRCLPGKRFIYDLHNPQLIDSIIPQDLFVTAGTFATRTLKLYNSGNGFFNSYFYFSDSLAPGTAQFLNLIDATLYIDNTLIATFSSPDSIKLSFSYLNLPDSIIPNGNLRVVERFFTDTCVTPGDNDTYLRYDWGCEPITSICISQTKTLRVFESSTSAPLIHITRLEPQPDISRHVWDSTCFGDSLTWRFRIQNDDSATTYTNIRISLYPGAMSFHSKFFTYVPEHTVNCTPAATSDSIRFLSDYYTDLNYGIPSCLNDHPDALFSIWFEIDSLPPDSSYEISFQTVRCCPDDEVFDSLGNILANHSTFNEGIYFNRWALAVSRIDLCTGTRINIGSPVSNSLYLSNSISTNTNFYDDRYPNLSLIQDYAPEIGDLYVPHDSLCGSPAGFTIRNIGFIGAREFFQDTVTRPPYGQFRVVIEMLDGLELDTSAAPFFQYAFAPFNVWDQEIPFASIPAPTGIGLAWEGFFRFDSTNFVTFDSIAGFMNQSEFHFSLRPCCDGSSNPWFRVKFYVNPLPEPQCDSCYIPLTYTTDTILIHCPGCTTFGIETINMSLVRDTISYGFYDRNNNGLADTPLTRISANDTIVQDIRRTSSIAGDHLIGTMNAVFHDGSYEIIQNGTSDTIRDLRYTTYLQTNDSLKYVYIEQNIDYSDTGYFNLVPDSARLLIQSGVNVYSHSVNLNTELIRSGNTYFYKFLVDSLSVGSVYQLEINDQFSLTTYFRLCRNYLNGTSMDVDNNRFYADPFGVMYATDTLLSSIAYIPHTILTGDEGFDFLCTVPVDSCALDADTLDPNWLYFCGGHSSRHRFYTNRMTRSSLLIDGLTCNKVIEMWILSAIGGDARNVFPFEFRPPFDSLALPGPQFRVDIPPGLLSNGTDEYSYLYTFSPGCSGVHNNKYNQLHTTVPVSGLQDYFLTNDLECINESVPHNTSYGCVDFVLTDTFNVNPTWIGDEYFKAVMRVHLYPDCDSSSACTIPVDTGDIQVELAGLGCNNNPAFGRTMSSAGFFYFPYLNSSDTTCDDTLLVMTPPSEFPVNSTQVNLTFQITNTSNPFTHCENAYNAWVFIPDSFLQNMTITCNTPGPGCGLGNDTVSVDSSNGLFELNVIGCGQTCTYTLHADYATCLDTGLHTLPIWYGWHCGPYPNNSSNTSYPASMQDACVIYEPDTLILREADVIIDAIPDSIYLEPTAFVLCDTFHLTACVRSQIGGVNNLVAEINLNDSLLLLDTVNVFLIYHYCPTKI